MCVCVCAALSMEWSSSVPHVSAVEFSLYCLGWLGLAYNFQLFLMNFLLCCVALIFLVVISFWLFSFCVSIYMFTMPDVVECTLELMGNVILVTVWFASPLSLVSIDELYVDLVSSNVDGTRYFPSPCCNLLDKLCAVLPLRFERVEAADVLLLFREHRREPSFQFSSIHI